MSETAPAPPALPPAPETPLRAAHEAAGAAFVTVAGRELPRHFGDPAGEYRAAREAAIVADRADRALVRLRGKDPVKMVHGLLTNDLLNAPAGRAVYGCFLTPKGRTVAEVRALRRAGDAGPEVVLDLPREALAGTVDHLRKFVPPMFARWAVADGELHVLGVYGPASGEMVARALGLALPAAPAEDDLAEGETPAGRVLAVHTREGDGPGWDLVVPAAGAAEAWAALTAAGARPAGRATTETLRIEAGRPRYGADLGEDVIPTEAFEAAGLMPRAVSFTKGCYTGQEVIVRIAHRGHVNRHLRGLRLGDAAAPAPGTPLLRADTGKEVGRITSVAASPRLGETVALGFVRREVEPGETVRVGAVDGPAAVVAALPFAGGGG